MFTPPPLRRFEDDEKDIPDVDMTMDSKAEPVPLPSPHVKTLHKKQIGRRIRLIMVLATAVLILVTLSTRHCTRSNSPRSNPSNSTSDDWFPLPSIHKRHPQVLSVSNPVSGNTRATGGLQTVAPNTPTPTSSVPQTSQTIPPAPPASNPPALPTPFPQPYDSVGATTNLSTQACQAFFTNMTQADDFRKCRPLSLLLSYSNVFIQVSIVFPIVAACFQALDHPVPDCDETMH